MADFFVCFTFPSLYVPYLFCMLSDMDVQALNNGLIACYYYIKYQTIETFGETLKPKRTMRGILEVTITIY